MLKYLQDKNVISVCNLLPLIVAFFFVFCVDDNINAQNSQVFDGARSYKLGIRVGLNMTTLTGDKNNGLELGGTLGVGAKYSFAEHSSFYAELQYAMHGSSNNYTIDRDNVKVKIYGKTRLHYLCIPIVYKYYFTDILGLELGPQFGFCLAGKTKTRTGNEDWNTTKLSSYNYNVFDFGIVAGVYTNNLTPEEDLFVCLRAYFGLTNVMKDAGSNKNLCIQLGIGYVFGE